ncbi:MAG: 6-bladed beta-propeller [Rectinemataceae bacterium]
MKAAFALFFWALFAALPAAAQFSADIPSPGAAEQLRLGVQAFHRGRYAESILLLEKSLAYQPDSALIQYWVGRAYYQSGFEETALRAWEPLLSAPDAPPFLKARAEYIRASRALDQVPKDLSYVEVERYRGQQGKTELFLRPSAILSRRDGSTLVVGHGSNELLTLDSSGIVRKRDRGGLAGLDRPFGIAALPDGTLFVSEFRGDRILRIAPDGSTRAIGSSGRGPGNFLGPQYIACDDAGYVYVDDYGNDRICKLDSDGNFVLSFGGKQDESGFSGLESPSGLVVKDGTVYVADSLRKSIFEFDGDGNYLGVLAQGQLHFPEGLALWQGGTSLLVADTDRIVSIDLSTETLDPVYSPPDRHARIVDAVPDHNGNLLYCDFDASAVAVLSESSQIAAGYDVEIERIMADAFPVVDVDVSVRDRSGSPVVGLRERNFYLTERLSTNHQMDEAGKAVVRREVIVAPAMDQTLIGVGQLARDSHVAVLIERSSELSARSDELRSALNDLYTALDAAGLSPPSLFTAGEVPARQTTPDVSAVLRLALLPASGSGRFDAGLRLAATSLLPSGARDAIIYVGTGDIDESSFVGTSLSELGALLKNNEIHFFAVVLGTPSASLRYLAQQSDGAVYSASRPRGLGDLAADLVSSPSGRYRLRFTSKADSGFGRDYLAIGVEAYLYEKSGRDELGYYAPLK